ncbi:MAG TPA: GGDEF domain-containing protein [Candidatus Sulfotelmatobacter sp.]|nr:GGDEF domain-containing protein [Candidatus Sulfotelmatobacter sp.]
MPVWNRKTLQSLVVPGGILLAGVALFDYLGWLTLTLPALHFLYYCGLIGGMLLAWRFHSSRIFFALCVLFLSSQVIALFGGTQPSLSLAGMTAVYAIAVLLPINYLLIALMQERGFTSGSAAPVALFLFVEFAIVAILSRSAETGPALAPHPRRLEAAISLPNYTLLLFAVVLAFLVARVLLNRKPVDGALLWSLSAFFLSLHFAGSVRLSTIYSVTAVCILAVSIIENSYLLAYHDELTTLPSRRAFNDALLRLQEPYAIAVVDIDHFKQFNDTYGHDTGDQVLRLVASNLSRVTGGGQAYRCGGEEFTILFPGKTTPEVVTHLERLRSAIESSEFQMRGDDRRTLPRGPDRRNARVSGRAQRKGHVIRKLTQEKRAGALSVTVSIGVAMSEMEKSDPELAIEAADKALYRAKANGRNRLEIAPSRRGAKVKAAGIA